MEIIRTQPHVREQYKTAANLQTRISIHAKYGVNKQSFGEWIFGQYRLRSGDRILELGCGDGSMWKTHALPDGAHLLLTDFSPGMLAFARENIPTNESIAFEQVDIQDIPCPDEAFDVVIANMMLYHVPDLHRALAEVRRVLKPDGIFYCATYGNNGIAEYLQRLFADEGVPPVENGTFTLQNGEDILREHFSTVEQYRYEDHLEVTDAADLAEYALSLGTMADFRGIPTEKMLGVLEKQRKNGVTTVPKEYGMFAAGKSFTEKGIHP